MFIERQTRLTGVPDVRRRVSMPTVDLEDLESLKKCVGREIGVTGWLSLTQERIEQFAEATEDRPWIHLG
jgi:acyl dehydratase